MIISSLISFFQLLPCKKIAVVITAIMAAGWLIGPIEAIRHPF